MRQIIIDQLGLGASEVKLSASFVDDLGAGSLDLGKVGIGLEEAFALKNSGGDAKRMVRCRTRWITFRGM